MSNSTPITFEADADEGAAARLLKWLVSAGDEVAADQPLVEIETDKVTLEVAAPHAGTVTETLVEPGAQVAPGELLGHIAKREPVPAAADHDCRFEPDESEGTTARLSSWLVAVGDMVAADQAICEVETDKVVLEVCAGAEGVLSAQLAAVGDNVESGQALARIAPGIGDSVTASPVAAASEAERATPKPPTERQIARHRLSPAVRRVLSEHPVDIAQVDGSGRDGRVTKQDLLDYLASAPETPQPQTGTSGASTRVPHTLMRLSIARQTTESLLETSPHVTSVFECDMSRVVAHRNRHKAAFAERGIHLTYTAYFLAASTVALRAVPQVNARFHDDYLEMFSDINIGVGTALGDAGLVAPVVFRCQDMSLGALARSLQQRTEQARSGNLARADMQGGTFTISNHGVSGSLFASPIIINQPQVAILGVGKMEKRIRVETVDGEDAIRIRPMCYVTLSIDHRALDAFQTNRWLASFVEHLETFDIERSGIR